MQKKITNDGSITYFNEKYKEHYHSVSGAKEEALKKFILPSLKYLKLNKKIKILDVCFGLGYNSAAAIDVIKKKYPNIKIEIIGLENDMNILNKILNNNIDFDSYSLIKKCINNNLYYENENLKIKIILNDAIKEIKNLNDEFDLIFHDPFSIKKMPDFWSQEFIESEYNLLKNNGILTTYSCSKFFRNHLKKLKFKIYDVEPIGRKAPSTLAIKSS
ncbi:MAG: MnmC family methyltransferase [Candidatus Woesearchaeota archaeon]